MASSRLVLAAVHPRIMCLSKDRRRQRGLYLSLSPIVYQSLHIYPLIISSRLLSPEIIFCSTSQPSMSHHSHAPWRKSVLIPFWCLQLFFECVDIAVLALTIGIVDEWDSSNDSRLTDAVKTAGKMYVFSPHSLGPMSNSLNSIAPIYIGVISICLILTIAEIILLARRRLKPATFLIMNVIKTTVWTGLFILNILSYASRRAYRSEAVGLGVSALLLYV